MAERGEVLEARSTREGAMDGELTHKIATLTAQLDEAHKEADLDTVTGLSSRRVLDRELARATYRQKLFGDPICLLLIDLHRFKNINDLHGHATGDELAVLLLYVTRDVWRRQAASGALPRRAPAARARGRRGHDPCCS